MARLLSRFFSGFLEETREDGMFDETNPSTLWDVAHKGIRADMPTADEPLDLILIQGSPGLSLGFDQIAYHRSLTHEAWPVPKEYSKPEHERRPPSERHSLLPTNKKASTRQ